LLVKSFKADKTQESPYCCLTLQKTAPVPKIFFSRSGSKITLLENSHLPSWVLPSTNTEKESSWHE